MFRKLIITAVALGATASLAACGGSNDQPKAGTAGNASDPSAQYGKSYDAVKQVGTVAEADAACEAHQAKREGTSLYLDVTDGDADNDVVCLTLGS